MNILREVRRVSHKRSMPIRIIFLLTFCVIFVVTTYAWFSTQKDVRFRGMEADLTPWYVAYYINDETSEYFNETVTFTIDELYPGMPNRDDFVHIYNMSTNDTNIKYELISVKVFGREVLGELDVGVTTNGTGKTYTIFSADTEYPFEISYTYDKTFITGEYSNENPIESAHATFNFDVSWPYEGQSADDAENLAKDMLDTKFGKDAYTYYNVNNGDPSKAIEVQVKITSSMAGRTPRP